jgi:hypothetical protein
VHRNQLGQTVIDIRQMILGGVQFLGKRIHSGNFTISVEILRASRHTG